MHALKLDGITHTEELHYKIRNWKSEVKFIEYEIQFFHKLLSTYSYEPITPNFYERLEEYKTALKEARMENKSLYRILDSKDRELDGIQQSGNYDSVDFHETEISLGGKMSDNLQKYRAVRKHILQYAGNVLKRRSP